MSSIFISQLVGLLPVISAFVHPGLMVNDADITRIKSKLAAQLDPWQSSWVKLTGLVYSQSTYTNNAVPGVYRDTANGVTANA